MKLVPEQTRRRSLLKLPRAERLELSLWQSLLIAYLALLMLILTGKLISGDGVDLSVMRSMVMGIVYATPITVLAHYGTKLTRRIGDRISWGKRVALLLALWMASGALGSLITYAALLLFRDDTMALPPQWILPMILGNAVIAIAIGGVVLLIEYANGGLRRRSAMLGQEDLLAAELQAARNVQQSLLPAEDLRIAGFDISGATDPAVEIGGDYYDYISFADGTKGILVADAAGKGVPAALIMAKFQGMAQALSIHLSDAHEFFAGLNDTLRIRLDRRSFITVGMIAIDLDDCCAFFRAGHNPLLLWRAAGRTIENSRPAGIARGGDDLRPLRADDESRCRLHLPLAHLAGPDGAGRGDPHDRHSEWEQ